MKKIIFWGLILILNLSLASFSVKNVKADSDAEYNGEDDFIFNDRAGILDENLYREILFELDKKSTATLTEKEAESITCLNIEQYTGRRIKSLLGIRFLKNLRTLKLGKCKLKNIDELAKLSDLEEFSIADSKIQDWTSLNNLLKLKSLALVNCGLTDSDVEAIVSNHLGLEGLNVSNNDINSLEPIFNLTELQALAVDNCHLKTVKGIHVLKKLVELSLIGNQISDISGLEQLTELWSLELDSNKIKKLVNLKSLEKLSMEYTSFYNNMISKAEFKKNLPEHIRSNKWYITNQYIFQKLKKKLVISKLKKITKNTKKIKGITEEKAKVVLATAKGKKIQSVKADKNGKFVFKKLDLAKFKGRIIKIIVYMKYDDQINGESNMNAVRTVKFRVK